MAEQSIAIDAQHYPFHFQASVGLPVWQNATLDPATQTWVPLQIPEGRLPYLWPLVVLSKLVDDDNPSSPFPHENDPASLTAQGGPTTPVVIMQGITILGDNSITGQESLFSTAVAGMFNAQALFDTRAGTPHIFLQDHVTVLIRPSVICFDALFDPANPDKRGVLVSPVLTNNSADLPTPVPNQPVVPTDLLTNTDPTRTKVNSLVGQVLPQPACLPTGRYAINAVYPDGQAWTVPNEAGACSGTEGSKDRGWTDYSDPAHPTCTLKPRSVLYSQGNRAVVEVTAATDPTHCQGASAVPAACLPH
jgi:hypothetical protein